MRHPDLARDYVRRAEIRLRALHVLFDAESWADVVLESQDVVELTFKGLLRAHGVAPPRVHEVSDVLEAEGHRLPDALAPTARGGGERCEDGSDPDTPLSHP